MHNCFQLPFNFLQLQDSKADIYKALREDHKLTAIGLGLLHHSPESLFNILCNIRAKLIGFHPILHL